MSCNDRNAGAVRPWRQLTRVLVVAGATVAGTSAAWLVGQALPAEADPAGMDPTAVQQDPAGLGASAEQGLRELVPGGAQLPADGPELPSAADVPAVTGAIVDPPNSGGNPPADADPVEPGTAGQSDPDPGALRLDVPPTAPGQEATPLLAAKAPDSGGLDVELAGGDLARAELSPSAPPGLELGGRTVLPDPAEPGAAPSIGDPAGADPLADRQPAVDDPAASDDTAAPELADGDARTGTEQDAPLRADSALGGPGSAPQPLVSAAAGDAHPDPGDQRATTAPRVPVAPPGGCSGPADPGQPTGLGCHFGPAAATPPFASGQVPDRADEVGGPAEPQPGTTPD